MNPYNFYYLEDFLRFSPFSPNHANLNISFYIKKTGCNIKVFEVYVIVTLTAVEAVSASFGKRSSAISIS
jgi:hypothetical protein